MGNTVPVNQKSAIRVQEMDHEIGCSGSSKAVTSGTLLDSEETSVVSYTIPADLKSAIRVLGMEHEIGCSGSAIWSSDKSNVVTLYGLTLCSSGLRQHVTDTTACFELTAVHLATCIQAINAFFGTKLRVYYQRVIGPIKISADSCRSCTPLPGVKVRSLKNMDPDLMNYAVSSGVHKVSRCAVCERDFTLAAAHVCSKCGMAYHDACLQAQDQCRGPKVMPRSRHDSDHGAASNITKLRLMCYLCLSEVNEASAKVCTEKGCSNTYHADCADYYGGAHKSEPVICPSCLFPGAKTANSNSQCA